MTTRYTAIVEIMEVIESAPTRDRGVMEKGQKESRELAKLVVRDETLEGLKTKLAAHVSLV